MSKKDKIFTMWIAISMPFMLLCAILGGILGCFNELVGFIFLTIGIGILLCATIPYITWCIGGIIKSSIKDED